MIEEVIIRWSRREGEGEREEIVMPLFLSHSHTHVSDLRIKRKKEKFIIITLFHFFFFYRFLLSLFFFPFHQQAYLRIDGTTLTEQNQSNFVTESSSVRQRQSLSRVIIPSKFSSAMTHWHEEEEEEEGQSKGEYCDIFLYNLIFMFGVEWRCCWNRFILIKVDVEGKEREKKERGERRKEYFSLMIGRREESSILEQEVMCVVWWIFFSVNHFPISFKSVKEKERERNDEFSYHFICLSFLPSSFLLILLHTKASLPPQ